MILFIACLSLALSAFAVYLHGHNLDAWKHHLNEHHKMDIDL